MKALPYDLTFKAYTERAIGAGAIIVVIAILLLVVSAGIAWSNRIAYFDERQAEETLLSAQVARSTINQTEGRETLQSSSDVSIASKALSYDWRTKLRTVDSAAATSGVKLLAVHIDPIAQLEEMIASIDTPFIGQDLLSRLNNGDQRWLINEQAKSETSSSYVVNFRTRGSRMQDQH